jgi:hypothetical protein
VHHEIDVLGGGDDRPAIDFDPVDLSIGLSRNRREESRGGR